MRPVEISDGELLLRRAKMGEARHRLDWQRQIELSIDPAKARHYREEGGAYTGPTCTMCGEYCAIKTYKRAMRAGKKERGD